MHPGTRSRLTRHQLDRFPGDTLFARLARAVCEAECLPRKELYEAWETARRIRRRLRGAPVVDLAAGHGLLAWVLLLLDDTSATALCVDPQPPASAARIAETMTAHWPRLKDRVTTSRESLTTVELPEGALLASIHGCGDLTDQILDRAIQGRHPVAVLPCCHSIRHSDDGGLSGWMESALAIDATRAARLRQEKFEVWTVLIPEEITPKNRLLMARPQAVAT